jgi:hypothetical protein
MDVLFLNFALAIAVVVQEKPSGREKYVVTENL